MPRIGTRVTGRVWLLAAAGCVVVLASACHAPINELNPDRKALTVATKAPLGRILVDGNGRTVYLFEKDEADESYCQGACASVWVPMTTSGAPRVAGGLNRGKVDLLQRGGGLSQVVYNGHPLYYYQADTDTEDTYGQEQDQFGAEWYALTPAGDKAEAAEGGGYDS